MIQIWLILTLLSAFFTSIKDILSKKIFTKKIESNIIIYSEYIFLFLITTCLFFSSINFLSFFQNYNLYLAKAFFIFSFSYFYLHLLKEFEISQVAPLLNLSPVFLLILSSIFLSEIITSLQLFGIFIIIVATYFLEVNFHHHQKNSQHKINFDFLKKLNWKTIGIVCLMLILISFCAIIDKIIFNSGINVYTNMFFSSSIILICMSIYFIFKKELIINLKQTLNSQIFFISLFNNLSTIFILLAIAIPDALVSLVIPIKRTSTLFSALFGGILFHENHLIKKIIATIFMLIGITLIAI